MTGSRNAYHTSNKRGGNAGVFFAVCARGGEFVSSEPAWTQMGAEFGGSSAGIDYVEVPLALGGMTKGSNQKVHFGG